MNKKFKNLFLAGAIALGLAGVAVSCTDYDGDINELTARVQKLENTVSALQSAINSGSVITDVTPITNGVKVTLSNGKSFDITNGTNGADGKDGVDGQNGKDGKDGSVVTIGANGNWFIDGVDTGFPSKGDKGDPGKDGVDGKDGKDGVDGKDGINGQDGKDGVDGKDGKDGINGQDGKDGVDGKDGKDALQIWYQPCTDKSDANYGKWVKYTYDPATKQTTSEVTTIEVFPEGTITAVYDKDNNKLTFHNVEGVENGVLEIKLAADLKSLALIPEALMEGLGYIEFPYIVEVYNLAGKNDEEQSYRVQTSAPVEVTYRLNPENADVAAYDWSFINRTVKTYAMETRSKSDRNDRIKLVGGPVVDGGEATFTIKMYGTWPEPKQCYHYSGGDNVDDEIERNNNDIIALQTKVDGETITSDYAYIGYAGTYWIYELIHKDFTKTDKSPVDKEVREYRESPINITGQCDDELYRELPTPQLLYTDTLDLKDYVTLAADGWNVDVALAEDLGLDVSYKFELCNEDGETGKPYFGEDGYTDQNKFVTLTEDGVMAVDPKFLNLSTRPAVNRTPQVKVTASVVDYSGRKCVLAYGFIKVRIVEEKTAPVDPVTYFKTYTNHYVLFCGDKVINFTNPQTVCPDFKDDKLEVTWEEVNKNVLGGLGLSYEAFLNEYDTDNLYVFDINKDQKTGQLDTTYVPVGLYTFPAGISYFAKAPEEWATSTNIISLYVDKGVKSTKDTVWIEFAYKAKNNSAKTPNVGFKFGYEVTPTKHEHDFANPVRLILNPDYLLGKKNVPVEAKPASLYVPSTENYDVWGGVRVKGKADSRNNFVYASSIIEHFEEYGKNIKLADDATISFEIMHSDKTWKVNYLDDDFKFIQDGEEKDVLTFTANEFKAIIAAPATSPDIKYMKSFLTKDVDVLVKVTEKCTSTADTVTPAKEKVGYYYVVFQTPFKVEISNSDVVLGTFKSEADTTYISADVKVVERENEKNVIYTYNDSTKTFVASPYAKTQYGLSDVTGKVRFNGGGAGLSYPYASQGDTKDSFGGNLTYNSNDKGLYVAWVNLGTDLQNDKYARYTLVAEVGDLYTLPFSGKVTVLSTANTKAKWATRADKLKEEAGK